MEQAEIDTVLDQIAVLVTDQYVFPQVVPDVRGAVRSARAAGRYPAGVDPATLAARVTEDLQSVNGDRHLRLVFSAEELPPSSGDADTDAAAEHAEYERLAARSGAGVTKVEILPHNLGYLRVERLLAPSIAGPAMAAALTLVASTDALILDLRRRAGGSPWAVTFLASYFLPAEPRYLYGVYLRQTDTIKQYWSQPYLPGPRYGTDRPLAVLTSRDTFSAGESLASCLREQNRATLVGETTGGGAHPCEFYRVHPHLRATIPVGRTVSVVTGTNWEGIGLTPDIDVTAGLALERAQDLLEEVIDQS